MKNRIKYLIVILFLFSCNDSATSYEDKKDSVLIIKDEISPRPLPLPQENAKNSTAKSKMKETKSAHKINTDIRYDKYDNSSKTHETTVPSRKDFNFGRLVYQVPEKMKLFKTYSVSVRINRDTTDDFIFKELDSSIPVRDTVIKTSSVMTVEVIDPDAEKSFDIVKNNDVLQLVDTIDYTEWVFNVMPLKSGKHSLHIVVSVIRDGQKKQKVYAKDVVIAVNPIGSFRRWWSKNWQWSFVVIIIPLAKWYYDKKKKPTH